MERRLDPLDRRIVALALPALGALVVEPLYNLTDSAILGHLGKVPLGGLAVAMAGLNVVGWVAAFIEMATVSVVSFRRAAGDDAGAARSVGAAYLLSAAVGLGAGALIAVSAPVVTALLGGHGRVGHDAVVYLRIAAIGMPPLLVSLAGNGHLTGLADTRRPFLIALVSNVVNVALEIVLVYGVHLGVAGSALGTVAAQLVAAACFLVASHRARVRPKRPSRSELRELVRDAVPLTTRTVALGSALLATTAIAARLGTATLGGHQVAMQIWNLLALTLDALAVPAQVYVSEALGRGDLAAAREIGRRTLRMGLVVGAGVGAVTMAVAPVLPRVFSPNGAVEHEAMLALLVCGLQQPAAATAFVLDGLVLGAARYREMRRAMLLALVGFVPLAAATLAFHGIGILGIWLAMLCWLVTRSALLGRTWRGLSTVPIAS